VNFFFDNNTAPALASTIDGYVSYFGDRAFHIENCSEAGLSLSKGRHTEDVEWITALGESPFEWIVVTGDKRIHTVPAEKEAFRRAGLKGILLPPSTKGKKYPVHQQASNLLWRWPELVNVIDQFKAPTLIGIPQSKGGKLNALQW
jgi:hypothetical protein